LSDKIQQYYLPLFLFCQVVKLTLAGLSQSRKKGDLSPYDFVSRQRHNERKVAMKSNTGQVMNLGSLDERFAGLSDKRKAKGKR